MSTSTRLVRLASFRAGAADSRWLGSCFTLFTGVGGSIFTWGTVGVGGSRSSGKLSSSSLDSESEDWLRGVTERLSLETHSSESPSPSISWAAMAGLARVKPDFLADLVAVAVSARWDEVERVAPAVVRCMFGCCCRCNLEDDLIC